VLRNSALRLALAILFSWLPDRYVVGRQQQRLRAHQLAGDYLHAHVGNCHSELSVVHVPYKSEVHIQRNRRHRDLRPIVEADFGLRLTSYPRGLFLRAAEVRGPTILL
jgi:hypothetical protein